MTSHQELIDQITMIDATPVAKDFNTPKPTLYTPGCNTDATILPINEWLSYSLFSGDFDFDMETTLSMLDHADIHVDTEFNARLSKAIPDAQKLPAAQSTALINFWQQMCGYYDKRSIDVMQVVNWTMRYLVNGPELTKLEHDYNIEYLGFERSHLIFRDILTQTNFSKQLLNYFVTINDKTLTRPQIRAVIISDPNMNVLLKLLCHAFLIANASVLNETVDFSTEKPTYSWQINLPCTTILSRGVNPNKWLIPMKEDCAFMRFMHILLAPMSPDNDTTSDYIPKRIPDNVDQSTPDTPKKAEAFITDDNDTPEIANGNEDDDNAGQTGNAGGNGDGEDGDFIEPQRQTQPQTGQSAPGTSQSRSASTTNAVMLNAYGIFPELM